MSLSRAEGETGSRTLRFTDGLPLSSGHYIFVLYDGSVTEGYFDRVDRTVTCANLVPPQTDTSFITFGADGGKFVAFAPTRIAQNGASRS